MMSHRALQALYWKRTDRDAGDLAGPVLDGLVDWWSCISLGGAAAALGAQVKVHSEQVEAELGLPMCDERFAGFSPDGVGRIDASRVQATYSMSSTTCRDEGAAYLSLGCPRLPSTLTASVDPPAVPFTSFKYSGRYKKAVRMLPPG